MSDPTVTVLMAVYNGEKHIRPTIDSIILCQTFKEFEFIIVNDASTDATVDLIKSYKESRIILHHNKKNIGQTKSLNIGLNFAKGKYIARIDSGDVSLPMRLRKQVSFMENHPEITILGTSAFRYYDNGRLLNVVHMPDSQAHILQRIFYASPVVHISAMMKRDAVLHFGGYDEEFDVLADYQLWSRLLQDNHRIYNLGEILVGYLVSPKSFGSVNRTDKSVIEASRIIRSNIEKIAKLSISDNEATNIYKMLTFDMKGLSFDEVLNSEKNIITVFKKLGISSKDIQYVLMLTYLKYLKNCLTKSDNRLIFQHAFRRVLSKNILSLPIKRIYKEIVSRFFQSLFWRFKRIPIPL